MRKTRTSTEPRREEENKTHSPQLQTFIVIRIQIALHKLLRNKLTIK